MESARPAVPTDVGRIVELGGALRAELGTQRGGSLWQRTVAGPGPDAAAVTALLAQPATAVLVGCLDDTVVGYAVARVRSLDDGGRLAEVLELYVEPGAREVGVGEALVGSLLAWAAAEACLGVDATALPGNRAAKNFFETHGFVARSLTMHRPLGGPAS